MRVLVISVALLLSACSSDTKKPDSDGTAGSGGGGGGGGNTMAGSGGAKAGSGGAKAGGSGGASGSGSGGTTNTAGDSGAGNTACETLKQDLKKCGLAVPDKECKADNLCMDSCTLHLDCTQLRDLEMGLFDATITACFKQCDAQK